MLKHKMAIYHCIVMVLLHMGQTRGKSFSFVCCSAGTELLKSKPLSLVHLGLIGFMLQNCPYKR